jgi:hypothetical protein
MNSSSKMDLYAPGMKREDGRPNMRHRYYLPTIIPQWSRLQSKQSGD